MVELQPVARDDQMSQLGFLYPNGGDEPNTKSTLSIRMHPGHGNSSHAHFVMMTDPLICVDL